MAYQIYKNGDNTNSKIIELIADTPEDISELSVNYTPGSICLVISDSSVYMLGIDKVWHQL